MQVYEDVIIIRGMHKSHVKTVMIYDNGKLIQCSEHVVPKGSGAYSPHPKMGLRDQMAALM